MELYHDRDDWTLPLRAHVCELNFHGEADTVKDRNTLDSQLPSNESKVTLCDDSPKLDGPRSVHRRSVPWIVA